MKVWMYLLPPLILAGCNACGNGAPRDYSAAKKQEAGVLRMTTWNVQALFDGSEDGCEYGEYVESAGWTKEKYLARLNGIAHALDSLEETPDILALIEVEKSQILEDLANDYLKEHGYHWSFFGNNEGAPLGIGVLSRLPFTLTRVHSLSNQGRIIPRPIVEVWVAVEGKPLALFLCHWKSKLGGEAESEEIRRAAARVVARRALDIGREGDAAGGAGAPIVVMGDLNENYDEFYRQGNKVVTALLPDDSEAAALVLSGVKKGLESAPCTDFLVISEKKPPSARYFSEGGGWEFAPAVFYSPWSSELSGGSYKYRDAWETIDHFLLNAPLFDGAGWDFDSCSVINAGPFINAYGYPASYNPKTGSGLSDHLPLFLTLRLLS
ncbi:MAG: endonuclease/exonuclease/phosphatase family protein [Treponema sp.]|jgi:endonuclease/exonuclease/phosphatase family metal-dependent hydrolase|nr:endonuclease/exonuclease/phosphatase family protein [Treponema sp.]